MATSGSTNFSTNRDELIKYALYNLGAINEGDTPTSTQVSIAAYYLNLITKAWQADGMPLFAKKTTSFALTASTTYTIGLTGTIATARPIRIYSAYIRDTSVTPNTDLELQIVTEEDYDDLTSKSMTGSPLQLYYDPQGAQGSASLGTIKVWPKPDANSIANKQIYISYQRPYEDFDAATDEPDFPQSWYMALLWQLTFTLAPTYGVPLEERGRWFNEALAFKQQALDMEEEEGSIYFQPNRRM